MTVLSTPYNFVPLSKKVIRPFWAHQISHDKPFSDAQSGTLQLTIDAKTPIFTRISVSRRVTDEAQRKELGSHFSKYGEHYFIPGSSIKGSIRNVLEILSFGDFGAGLIDKPYAMRDLTLDNYKELFSSTGGQKVCCGWLKNHERERGTVIIEDCGFPVRISHEEIDAFYKKPILSNWVKSFEKKDPNKRHQNTYNFSKGDTFTKKRLFSNEKLESTFNLIDGSKVKGTLVFTGQPAIKFGPDGRGTINVNHGESIKYKEFIFQDVIKEHSLETAVVEAFEFAYGSLYGKTNLNEPVFFHKDEKGKVVSFGLAYMYKIPFKFSVRSRVEFIQEKSENPDLAECIFGHLRNNPLKGRVSIEHAWAVDDSQPLKAENEVLNSPKATYYPTYVKQTVKKDGKVDKFKTFFDSEAIPSGWKRYPIHKDGIKHQDGSETLKTKFRPLPSGTSFSCSVHYHNLRLVELGALLSALSFHETEGCFHTFGMAKPLGYGQCALSITGIDEEKKLAALSAFENYMETELKDFGGWAKSEAIKELLAMSSLQDNSHDRSKLEYMKAVKDFADVKKDGQALALYSKLPGIKSKELRLFGGEITALPNGKSQDGNALEILKLQFEEKKKEKIGLVQQKLKMLRLAEIEKQQQADKEAEAKKRKNEADIAAEVERQKLLGQGMPVNGILENKTLAGTARAVKFWITTGGSVGSNEMDRIINRYSELYQSIKNEKRRTGWLEQCKKEAAILNGVLTNEQVIQIEDFLNAFQ